MLIGLFLTAATVAMSATLRAFSAYAEQPRGHTTMRPRRRHVRRHR
jgi:hypothetical protein